MPNYDNQEPSGWQARVGRILTEAGYREITDGQPVQDFRWKHEHALDGKKGGQGVRYDTVVYGEAYRKLYIEIDGPNHDPSRDAEKEQRAINAKAGFIRWDWRAFKAMGDQQILQEIEQKMANQPPEPTPTVVTAAAYAPTAPTSGVAHL